MFKTALQVLRENVIPEKAKYLDKDSLLISYVNKIIYSDLLHMFFYIPNDVINKVFILATDSSDYVLPKLSESYIYSENFKISSAIIQITLKNTIDKNCYNKFYNKLLDILQELLKEGRTPFYYSIITKLNEFYMEWKVKLNNKKDNDRKFQKEIFIR